MQLFGFSEMTQEGVVYGELLACPADQARGAKLRGLALAGWNNRTYRGIPEC